MNWTYLLFPLIGSCIGWALFSLAAWLLFHPVYPVQLMGFRLQGLVPRQQARWAARLGELSQSLISVKALEQKITHPDNVKKIMPGAASHIDHFLRVKLVQSMPVVGMLVGDTTINKLKSLFMDELEQLFPHIMQDYLQKVQEDMNIEQLVAHQIAGYPPEAFCRLLKQALGSQLRYLKWLGILLGCLTGLLQLAFLLLVKH